jgi:hypothetical protein
MDKEATMSHLKRARTGCKARLPSLYRLLLTTHALVATVLAAVFSQLPLAASAHDVRTPHRGPLISAEEAIALATGIDVGENDFRISDMGGVEDPGYRVEYYSEAAYNSTNNEYLVVWFGDDNSGSLVDNEWEIFGQRIDADTGLEVGGNDFRISDMGPDGDASYEAGYPDVAYSATDNEYLVVWHGEDNTGGLVDGEIEIFGQRIDGSTGAEVGDNDFRISDMGGSGDSAYGATFPAVVYNAAEGEYLVVWSGDDDAGGLVSGEHEIFGQLIDGSTGAETGTNDFRISDAGGTGDENKDAWGPSVAYNSVNNEYLVVWHCNDHSSGMAAEEDEVFGQRINGATGAETGTNDFRISDMGGTGDADYSASGAAIAYNYADNVYLVVWSGDDNEGGLVEGESEIFGQLINAATGAEVGTNDFRISDLGGTGNGDYDAWKAAVAYNGVDNEYLVVWQGDDDTGGLVEGEEEVFGQRIAGATGAEVGTEFRISDMGGTGDTSFYGEFPSLTYNDDDNQYLVIWYGLEDVERMTDVSQEIFGQRISGATGAEIGENDFRISDMGYDRTRYAAHDPAVAYNSTDNQYLVVWAGDDDTSGLVDGESEIFGQRIDAMSGEEVGENDFRISHTGGTGNAYYDAYAPAVAYNSTDNQYLVVWHADDYVSELVDNEFEIWGQRIDAATGAEVGVDFRISDMGGTGNAEFDAEEAAVAYNKASGEYLVVWQGDDDGVGLVDNELEIFGQRIDADTGLQNGTNDFQISQIAGAGSADYDAQDPVVVYNPDDDQYLVVWAGDSPEGTMVDDEFEIWGQRLSGAACAAIDGDIRITKMGGLGSDVYAALNPSVAYNTTDNQYLVVWYGDDDVGGLVDGEYEVFGQRLSSTLGALGGYFRISDMGPTGNIGYAAWNPAVAYNRVENEYLVVWHGHDNVGGLVSGEYEIFGQRIDAATGEAVGENDFRISDMGGNGVSAFDAYYAALACNDSGDEYLAVWRGDDNTGFLADNELEVFGQRIAPPRVFLPHAMRSA